MKQIILGTAGHIDHGKTTLIKAITGVNTDRLKEEQRRGITIELGFADLKLDTGHHLGIVDVPGHEKFVKNMVAGATGIDIVAMVIAADEGVMPQTREHMEICSLLGVQHGVVVITKMDLVDDEWVELVKEDIDTLTRNTFLEDAPKIGVSATKGDGIPDFLSALGDLANQIPQRSKMDVFRLPIDRVFSMKGFGTVITGTIISGKIRNSQDILIYPSNIPSKVRGIQVHNDSVDQAEAGMRAAINFQGLSKSSVKRGEVLSTPNALRSSYMLDVTLRYLKSNQKPFRHRTKIRLHTGTSEVLGVAFLLDTEEIMPGEKAIVQIRLENPVATIKDDRFVIRSYSPVRTIAGGRILNPIPTKHKQFDQDVIQGLSSILNSSPEEVIKYQARSSGGSGVTLTDLKLMTNLSEKKLDPVIQRLLSKHILIRTDKEHPVYIHQHHLSSLMEEMQNFLQAYHDRHPLKVGMPKEELKSKFPDFLNNKTFSIVFQQMIKMNTVIQEEENVRLFNHKISLAVDQEELQSRILKIYNESGLTPPYFSSLDEFDKMRDQASAVLQLLVSSGNLIKVKEDLFFHKKAVSQLKDQVLSFFESHSELTTPQFKELAGVSRKYLIPLIEYFDAQKLTIRIGDVRKLRKGIQ